MMLIFSKLKLTFCMTIKSSLRFERVNKVECDFSHWQISSFVCPWNTTWHYFYPTNPKARAKIADIENEVYCSSLPFSCHSPLFPGHALIFSLAFHFRVIPAIWKPGTDGVEAMKNTTLCKLHKVPNEILCITYLLWIIALCVLVSKGAVCFTVNAV